MKKNFPLQILLFGIIVFSYSSVAVAFFQDVPSTHPNADAILYLQQKNLVSGYPDGTFKPDQVIKRVEALKIITLAENIEDKAVNIKNFTDTSPKEWYWTYLQKAVLAGFVQGYPDGSFKPDKTVNLVENLKMLLGAHKVDLSSMQLTSNPYVDANKDLWYAKYLQYAKEKHLVDADNLNKIYPDKGVTRASFSEMMYRLLYIEEHNLSSYPHDIGNENVLTGLVEINIQDFLFSSEDILIASGTKVRWTNHDTSAHSVVSDDKKFDSGKLEKDASFEISFDKPGTYHYHCAIHPLMKGTITVM